MTCAYSAREPDELNLCEGDFIVVSDSELDNSADGWYQGMSWQMGCSGLFPGICTQRVAETETWTMHRYLCSHYSTVVLFAIYLTRAVLFCS